MPRTKSFTPLLAKIAGYPGVWRLVQQVKLQVDRFRRLTLPQKGRMQRVVREHAGIGGDQGARAPGGGTANGTASGCLAGRFQKSAKPEAGIFFEPIGTNVS